MWSWKWFLLSFFGGGTVFWLPDLVIPALDRNEQGYAVTIACPVVVILFYLLLMRIRKAKREGPSTAFFALCGMWILALSFTLLAQWIRSEQGLGPFNWGDLGYLLISSFMPTRIFEFVSLEGSIFALLLGTLVMIMFHFAFEIDRWIVPPGLSVAFRRSRRTE